MSNAPQNLANHRRIDPTYHGVLFLILMVNLVVTLVTLWRHPGSVTAWAFVMALGFLLFFFKLRTYALRNQDRLIRLEEQLRLERLLPGELKLRISELRVGQFVGLRFASDEEVGDRMKEALAEDLGTEAIKKRIQVWRPDTFRV